MVSTKKTPIKTPTKGKVAFEAHYSRTPLDTPATPTKDSNRKRKKETPKEWSFTHHVPDPDQKKKNGRYEGRNLITWTRPRMAEKLLLHMQYECARYKIDIPWDAVAHRLHPGSSGGAILQHMNRLRGQLVAEGHLVPPVPQKPGARTAVDPTIRGYVRAFPDTDDMTTTRPVPFTEFCDDRRFNLPDAFDERTPTQIKREGGMVATPASAPSAMSALPPARVRELAATPTPRPKPKAKSTQKYMPKNTPKPKATKVRRELVSSLETDSEDEYHPGQRAYVRRTMRRTAKPKASYVELDDDEKDSAKAGKKSAGHHKTDSDGDADMNEEHHPHSFGSDETVMQSIEDQDEEDKDAGNATEEQTEDSEGEDAISDSEAEKARGDEDSDEEDDVEEEEEFVTPVKKKTKTAAHTPAARKNVGTPVGDENVGTPAVDKKVDTPAVRNNNNNSGMASTSSASSAGSVVAPSMASYDLPKPEFLGLYNGYSIMNGDYLNSPSNLSGSSDLASAAAMSSAEIHPSYLRDFDMSAYEARIDSIFPELATPRRPAVHNGGPWTHGAADPFTTTNTDDQEESLPPVNPSLSRTTHLAGMATLGSDPILFSDPFDGYFANEDHI